MESAGKRTRTLGQWDGAKDGWQAPLPLKSHEKSILIDARSLRFAVPTFLLRLRAFVEWHLERGHEVSVLAPANESVATYMTRMGVSAGLPPETFVGLPQVEAGDSEVLVPITQLREFQEVDELGERIYQLFLGHSEVDVKVFASAMHMAASELCANAVEHGANPLGCYIAAQRYERPHRRTVLALGDLGVGIPKHMARQFPDLDSSHRRALRKALREGVTATGKEERGIGFTCVIEEAMASRMRYATLDIHSGTARLQQFVFPAGPSTIWTAQAPNKIGTWLTFEIGPLSSV